MEKILEVEVTLTGVQSIEGEKGKICMLPFTGVARGRYFNGKTIGEGVDTQRISKEGKMRLSARYLLEGEDYQGNHCKVFIENNGYEEKGEIFCKPDIVTDSPILKEWESAELVARVNGTEQGVLVSIYKEDEGKEFSILRDGLKLHAVLERPQGCALGEKGPLVVFMHGFTGDVGCVSGHPYQKITERLLAAGQSVLRFDFNGHGKSEGSFSNMNVLNEINDAIAVLEYVRSLEFVTEITLIGHSQGGVVGGMTAGYYRDLVSRLVLLAPAASLKTDAQKGTCFGSIYDTEHIPSVVPVGEEQHPVAGHYFRIARTLPIYEVTSQFEKPVLLICGGRDNIIASEVAEEYQGVLKKCTQITYPCLDHGLSGEDQEKMLEKIAEFVQER